MLTNHDDSARLVAGEPEGVTVSAHYVIPDGWKLSITVRRQFQDWRQASAGHYERLTTQELVDVLCSTLAVELEA